jgi:FG-GAP repeat
MQSVRIRAGTFGASIVTTLAIDNTRGAIVAGDVNEDGKTDLIVATVAGPQLCCRSSKMPQPKARRVVRPKLPKGAAKGRVFGIRLTDDDIKKLTGDERCLLL